MAHYQHSLKIQTTGKSLCKITPKIEALVTKSGITTGICHLFLRHTSASLLIQENADPDVLKDLETFFSRLILEGENYRHSTEGQDDMPAHIRTALTHTSECIPIGQCKLLLGTWQGIYMWEHRQHGSSREVIVHITGD